MTRVTIEKGKDLVWIRKRCEKKLKLNIPQICERFT